MHQTRDAVNGRVRDGGPPGADAPSRYGAVFGAAAGGSASSARASDVRAR